MQRLGLTYRIALAVAILLVLTAGLVSFIIYKSLNGQLERSEFRALTGVAGVHATLFEDKIDSLRQDTLILAQSPTLVRLLAAYAAGGASSAATGEAAEVLRAMLAEKPGYMRVRVIAGGAAGVELLRAEHDAIDGPIKLTADAAGSSARDESFFRIGSNLAAGKVYLSEVRLKRRDGHLLTPHIPVIHAVTGAYDGARRFLGMLVIDLDMRQVMGDFAATTTDGLGLYVFNDRGYCIMAPPGKACGYGFEFPGTGAAPELPRYLPGLAQAMDADSQVQYTLVDRENGQVPVVAGAWRKRLGFAGDYRSLTIAVAAPMDSALAGTRAAQTTIALLLFILLPLAMLGAWLMARSLIRPLRSLTESVKAFSEGRGDDVMLPVAAGDEVGVLARAFVEMRGQVRERTELEADARARNMVEMAKTGIFGLNEHGLFTFVNPAARRMLGAEARDLTRVSPDRLFCMRAEGNRLIEAGDDCALKVALRTGETQEEEEGVFWRIDGSAFPVRYAAVPIMRDGQCEGLVVTFEDRTTELEVRQSLIRARTQAEDAAIQSGVMAQLLRLSLRRTVSRDFLSAALVTVLTSIPWLSYRPKGAVYLVEATDSGEVLKLSAEYNLDEDLHDFPVSVDLGIGPTGEAVQTRTIILVDTVDDPQEAPAPGATPHGCYAVPILEGAKALGAMAFYIPAGYREQGGERQFLQKVADILSMGIVARISTQALSQAKVAAEAAAHAKSEFLATMSHEIRTPMNGMLGMAQLLEETALDVDQQDYVRIIQQSGTALLTVINDILDFSKIEAGRMTLEPISFDLDRAIHDVLSLLQPKANEKGLEIAVKYHPDCPRRLIGDAGRIRQILLNLAGNAIKFTETGYVLISVESEGITPDQEVRLRIAVEDTGIGIDSEAQGRLFASFSQADSSMTRKYGGTGLGLAICKKLVELMDGDIGVESQLGQGATFWLRLTLAAAESLPELPTRSLAGRRVLIVDDMPLNLRILSEMLSYWHMQVDQTGKANGALEMIRQARNADRPYDLVILDWIMPGMGGDALIKLIRSDPEPSIARLPAILLSSSGEKGDARRFAELGFNGYLAKPIQGQALHQVIAVVLGQAAEAVVTQQRPAGETIVTRHLVDESLTRAESAPGFHGRVLVAEDVLANQKVAQAMLQRLGMQVDIAENGQVALALWRTGDYRLVLMDCQMPVMDGYEATRSLRAIEAEEGRDRTPVVALTANVMPQERQRCLDAGMDDFMSKPFKRAELEAMLDHWLGSAAAPRRRSGPAVTGGAAATSLPTLDRQSIDAMRHDYPEDYAELLESFDSSVVAILARLDTAPDDPESVARQAHSLKSTAESFGALALADLARHLEMLANSGASAELKPQVASLRLEYERVKAALDRVT